MMGAMADDAQARFDAIAALLRTHEVGRGATITTPFGVRRLAYADLTATGRYLHFVEAWLRRLRPHYVNTHTAISSTGRVMTALREEARQVIASAVHAGPDDVVIFVGSGATSAVNKLVGLLGLRADEPLMARLKELVPARERPLVLVGPYEHHSNELPWLESFAEVEEVALGADGLPDLDDLRDRLAAARDRPLVIGAFSAASNVTGVLTDVRAVARVLHTHGALAVFDYAAAGPYAPIDMHPEGEPGAHIDAIFVSPHKFVGGPNASGVLVAHRSLFRCRVPERPGGGTVAFVGAVARERVDYTERLAEREEGGTPAIMGDLRAGIAFLVKDLLGPAALLAHEIAMAQAAASRLARHPRIEVLGPIDPPRLPILSFNVRGLHHDLISTLLDHLFGIQNRAGCSCAGPYGHRLLGLDEAASEQMRALIARGFDGIRRGWVRVTLPAYASPEDVEFLLSAIDLVAELGERFVPCYRIDFRSGSWRHIERPTHDGAPIALTRSGLEGAIASWREAPLGDEEVDLDEARIAQDRARYLAEARATADVLARRQATDAPRWNPPTGDAALDRAVWFRFVHASG